MHLGYIYALLVYLCIYYFIVYSGDSVGYVLFKKLLKRKQFYPIGLVRDNASYRKLINAGNQSLTVTY